MITCRHFWVTLAAVVLAIPTEAYSLRILLAEERTGPRGEPWVRHTIDDSSHGADGVRLCDVNGDGLMDIVTGWEEGGITRVYIHPAPENAAQRWPVVTVGNTPSVEDAVLVDLDADGQADVVSCCEGSTRSIFVHWAPADADTYIDASAWRTVPLPRSVGTMMWMFSVPVQLDGRHGVDLVAAGKGNGARIGWFEASSDSSRLDQWRWHPISPAGWIMSLKMVDMDSDGDLDILTTDRRGPMRGCRWLENPGLGERQKAPWKNHYVGGRDREVMFLTVADLDTDGVDDIVVASRPSTLLFFRRSAGHPNRWTTHTIPLPMRVGGGKGVAVGRIDADDRPDIVFSCEGASGDKSGIVWLSCDDSPTNGTWTAHEVSGPVGIKYDRLELLDVDRDGDLDVLCCEESQPFEGRRKGLGVFWHENPR